MTVRVTPKCWFHTHLSLLLFRTQQWRLGCNLALAVRRPVGPKFALFAQVDLYSETPVAN